MASKTVNKVMTAKEVISKIKIGINIGNCFDAFKKDDNKLYLPQDSVKIWGSLEPSEEWIKPIKDRGFNAIRVPITWCSHLIYDEKADFYLIDPLWLEYVKKFIDMIYKHDLYIIINCHHENFLAIKEFNEIAFLDSSKKLRCIWFQVSYAFREYDQKLIFEAMNEPRQTANPSVKPFGPGNEESWKFINGLNATFYDAVREISKTRILLFSTYSGSAEFDAMKNVNFPKGDEFLALSVHSYAPYFFTSDNGERSNHSFPGKSGWGKDYCQEINNVFEKIVLITRLKDIEVVISEFGSIDFGNEEDRIRWVEYFIGKSRDYRIPCFWWDNVNKSSYAIFDRKENKFFDEHKKIVDKMIETLSKS